MFDDPLFRYRGLKHLEAYCVSRNLIQAPFISSVILFKLQSQTPTSLTTLLITHLSSPPLYTASAKLVVIYPPRSNPHRMDSYPEEPLNLSKEDGFGYFPADISQVLNHGKYTIARKLGWGARSSTWLAWAKDEDRAELDHWAVQIFTVAASKDVEERLLPVWKNKISRVQDWNSFPNFRESFWETSVHEQHLCFVMSAYGSPFASLLRDAKESGKGGLPVHVVQYATSTILQTLEPSHKEKVLHGGVKLENLVFWPSEDSDEIPHLPVVHSQPLDNCEAKWDAAMSDVSDWMLLLAGFGHVQLPPYSPELGIDYSSAPETLLANPSCTLSTDVWMLGCLVFELITGEPLLTSTGSATERLTEIRDVLGTGFPDTWLRDENLLGLPDVTAGTRSLEQMLKAVLTDDEASAASAFLRKCFTIDPQRRCSVEDLQVDDAWVEGGAKCSCCYT
ncbi:hypothetical protein NMY22_g10909 [Coprinellus aureogranulatus]|nr:hypothetical protein NMY22_g10909 [Coprinellus aureogranulatus]